MASIQNLAKRDPFKLVGGDDMDEEMGGGFQSNLVHIRLQQRTGRKTLTTVQGLADVFDKKKLVKYFKKEFACNGTVVQHPEYGEVAQLQGDQRNNICSFLVREGLVKKDKLKVHGF